MAETVPGAAYEEAVMEAHAQGKPAPDLIPEEPYVMSETFQKWLVDAMRSAILESDDLGAALMGAANGKSDA